VFKNLLGGRKKSNWLSTAGCAGRQAESGRENLIFKYFGFDLCFNYRHREEDSRS
jgi:hypothetical protein